MNMRLILAAMALFSGSTDIGSAAFAHSKIVTSSPAQGATVSVTRNVSLTFSEAMTVPTFSVSIVMTAMPGMANHGEMMIRNFTQSWSEGNRKLNLKLRKPLPQGTYQVRWQATGADGHRVSGKLDFDIE